MNLIILMYLIRRRGSNYASYDYAAYDYAYYDYTSYNYASCRQLH